RLLSSGLMLGAPPNLQQLDVMPPLSSTTCRRLIDKVMAATVLTELPDLADDEVEEALQRLSEVESSLSSPRRQLHSVIGTIQAEIVSRYRSLEGEAAEA